jgi:hypothetical protein
MDNKTSSTEGIFSRTPIFFSPFFLNTFHFGLTLLRFPQALQWDFLVHLSVTCTSIYLHPRHKDKTDNPGFKKWKLPTAFKSDLPHHRNFNDLTGIFGFTRLIEARACTAFGVDRKVTTYRNSGHVNLKYLLAHCLKSKHQNSNAYYLELNMLPDSTNWACSEIDHLFDERRSISADRSCRIWSKFYSDLLQQV